MIWLEHGESRSYDAVFRVLDGAGEIAAAERRIAAIAQQPDEEFPRPSGNFPVLGGRSMMLATSCDRQADVAGYAGRECRSRSAAIVTGADDDSGDRKGKRDYSLVGESTRRRSRPGCLGRVVSHRCPAQGDEGIDAALRRAGDPRHDHLDRGHPGLGGWRHLFLGHAGGACRSFSSTACSTAPRATRAGTNAATAPPSGRAG